MALTDKEKAAAKKAVWFGSRSWISAEGDP